MKVFEFLPETSEMFIKRYRILKGISDNVKIGRRALSHRIGLTERVVRDEVNKLNDLGLINIGDLGMNITYNGIEFLDELSEIFSNIMLLPNLEKGLESALNVKKVIVVKGDTTIDDGALNDLGNIAGEYLTKTLKDDSILGVTGGKTILAMANEMKRTRHENVLVVPARGGFGTFVDEQSNSIASKFALKLNGEYKPLYLPDRLDAEIINMVLNNRDIKESFDLLENIDTLVFGIGRADRMAKLRELNDDAVRQIFSSGGVAEAFGHYLDIDGKEVYRHSTIGITMETFKKIPEVIAVVGSSVKAEAIIAATKVRCDMTLITDESAAMEILEKLNGGVRV